MDSHEPIPLCALYIGRDHPIQPEWQIVCKTRRYFKHALKRKASALSVVTVMETSNGLIPHNVMASLLYGLSSKTKTYVDVQKSESEEEF